MKKIYFTIVTIISTILFTAQTQTDQDMRVEFREISQLFMGDLKSVLMKNIKEGGPLQAINVCSDTAMALTDEIGKQTGVLIKRTTFKPRNRNNTPDKFEEKVLLDFQKKFEEGTLDDNYEYLEIIKIDSTDYARFMKPIFVQGPCLLCHGSENTMSKDVRALIKHKYKDDTAVDYKNGDLRGAISINKKL